MPPDPAPPPPGDDAELVLPGFDPAELLACAIRVSEELIERQQWKAPPWEEVARLLPKYEVTGDIGRGAMGAVYLGWHDGLKCRVAIKILPAEIAADERFIARFDREREALRKLHDTHIVPVYDAAVPRPAHFFIVMDFAEGRDLGRLLLAGPLPVERVLAIGSEICGALARAHAAGLIHRDVKPANILLNADGVAMLADFGLAGGAESEAAAPPPWGSGPAGATHLTATGAGVGTPHYAAPEQLRGEATAQSDLFSLGVTLYRTLTGALPDCNAPAPPSQFLPALDPALDRLLLSALAPDPAARPASARAMQGALDAIHGEAKSRMQGIHSRRSWGRRSLLWTLAVAVLVFALLFLTREMRQRKVRSTDDFARFKGEFGEVPRRDLVRGSHLGPVPTKPHPKPPVAVSAAADDPGIRLLAAGDTTGWKQCGPGGFTFADGVATSWSPEQGALREGLFWYGERKFRDFVVRVEFKVASLGSNSGIWLRCPDPGDHPRSIWTPATEIEIRGTGAAIGRTGAIGYFNPPEIAALRVEEWNDYEITAVGRHISVKLNGIVVNEGDLNLSQPSEGYLGLQNHFEGPVSFRNLRVKEL